MRIRERYGTESRLAMVLLRYLKGWSQGDLARAAGIAPSQVSVYDRGERPIPRDILERTADAVGFPRPLLDPLLHQLHGLRLAMRGGFRSRRVLGDLIAGEMISWIQEGLDAVLAVPETHGRVIGDREEALQLWEGLRSCTPAQRREIVEEGEEYQTAALCELLREQSRELAGTESLLLRRP